MEETKVNSFNFQKILPIIVIQLVIAFVYFGAVVLPWYDHKANLGLAVYQIFIHVFLLMFIWSYFRSVLGDPGRVPLYWGFFLDDPEHKKRRYCLLCHIFKPERCHHCSSCNRCVLNMDHHCPWINNCVGFYNRKYFMLMLIYVVLLTTTIFIGSTITAISLYQKVNLNQLNLVIQDSIFIVAYLINLIVLVMLTMFTNTHFRFVFSNTTTIEDLDKKRPNSTFQGTNYNMGGYYNWVQVFGRNPLLWPIPIFMDSGKPVGDGVVWPQAISVSKQTQ